MIAAPRQTAAARTSLSRPAARLATAALFVLLALGPASAWQDDRVAQEPLRTTALLSQALVQIVKDTAPAIVSISTVRFDADAVPGEPRLPGEDEGGLSTQMIPDPQRDPMRRTGIGSGMLIKVDAKPYIVTNHHVVQGVDRVVVRLSDKREFDATVKGWDPKVDVAILEIPEAGELPSIVKGDSDKLDPGELVLAIGSPFGLQQSVTVGIVSAVGRYGQGIEEYEDFIQTDAAINRGNSGGPLLNLKGQVVGMNTAIRTTHMGGNLGVGFAIPINMVTPVAEQLVRNGRVMRGWLGASVQNISDDLAQAFKLNEPNGVVVTRVVPGTPAQEGGLLRGDIITKIDACDVDSVNKLRNYIASTTPGSKVAVSVIRQGRKVGVELTVGEAPMMLSDFRPSPPKKTTGLGLSLQDVTADVAGAIGLSGPGGAVVTEVQPGGPATLARPVPLLRGDVILEVGRKPVKNAQEAREALKDAPNELLLLYVYRRGGTLFTVMRMPQARNALVE